jgi:hypothetical protein
MDVFFAEGRGGGCDLEDGGGGVARLGNLRQFGLRELHAATDGFNPKNILGKGGFGNVYRGKLADGALVAVKRLKDPSASGEAQFRTEVEMISLAVHRHLLRLVGFCAAGDERILVYPYMPNGSVASRLRGTCVFRSRATTQSPFTHDGGDLRCLSGAREGEWCGACDSHGERSPLASVRGQAWSRTLYLLLARGDREGEKETSDYRALTFCPHSGGRGSRRRCRPCAAGAMARTPPPRHQAQASTDCRCKYQYYAPTSR